MRIEPLAQHRDLIPVVVEQLYAEWHDFAPWSVPAAITERFLNSSSGVTFPYSVVAISDAGEFMGTGSIKLKELPSHPDKRHWLGEVFVPASLRGQGIATSMIEAIVEYSIQQVVPVLYLYTPDQQAFYSRLGWRPCGDDFVNGEPVTLMVRDLTGDHGCTLSELAPDPN
jgi:predicted N-acetyltransferase YhbS